MTDEQKEAINNVIVTLDSLTVTGFGNMSRVVGCIQTLSAVLSAEENNGGQTDEGT